MNPTKVTVLDHADAIELLPWYAANSLEPDERAAVRAHVESCADCSRELAELNAVHAAVSIDGAEEPPYPTDLVGKTLGRIDRLEAERPRTNPLGKVGAALGRIADALQWAATPRFARFAVVGQFALLLGFAGWLAMRSPEHTDYATLTGPATTTAQAHFTISFRSDTTVAAMNRALSDAGLHIVSGPSALGLYVVAADTGADGQKAIERLTASGMTTFAAPVPQ